MGVLLIYTRTQLAHCPACGTRVLVVLTRRVQLAEHGQTALYEFPVGECQAGHDIAWAAQLWKDSHVFNRRRR